MKHVRAGVLDIAYLDLGLQDAPPAILLHGFPYDVHSYDEVCPHLIAAGMRCLVPYLRGYGPTRFLDEDTPRSGQQAALGSDLLAFMDALGVHRAVLGGFDWGGRAACIVAALQPERCVGLVSCGIGYNIQDIASAGEPGAPEAERLKWYQYYFQTERGRAGLAAHRRDLCRLLWRTWSPSWAQADAAFPVSAEAFDNEDFVDVVIHSYRHRFGLVAGDPRLDDIEDQLAANPRIDVPTTVLLGADDGVEPPPSEDTQVHRFGDRYERRIVSGVGHAFPQEAPALFAETILAHARS